MKKIDSQPEYSNSTPYPHNISQLSCWWSIYIYICMTSPIKIYQTNLYRCIYIWLVVWNIFYFPINIGNVIIPTDFHIFQRGGPTTNQIDVYIYNTSSLLVLISPPLASAFDTGRWLWRTRCLLAAWDVRTVARCVGVPTKGSVPIYIYIYWHIYI